MEDITLDENHTVRQLKRALAAQDQDWIDREYAAAQEHHRLRVYADKLISDAKSGRGKKGGPLVGANRIPMNPHEEDPSPEGGIGGPDPNAEQQGYQ